ncbi:MarR family winged helix-turn-helix transcriptional regulator [Nitratireductor arenosus]|nr:MarR family transcriptional regulator [Nitratireductor arenosus]
MEDLDQGILPDLLGRQIRLTYLAAFRLVENRLAAFGITPQQFSLLAIVERNPGSRQSLLARARGLDKSTLVPMIDRLERDGMVERRPLATDRRIRTIWITERGKDILAEAIPAVQDGDRAIGLNLSEAEHQEFRRLLEKVRLGLAEQ